MNSLFSRHGELGEWYEPVILDPDTVFQKARGYVLIQDVLRVLRQLEEDPYSRYLFNYIEEGISRFGSSWSYIDILSVLSSCSLLMNPGSYLEIGVRRGRSMAMVAYQSPGTDLYGFDIWEPGYAGMENPGPDFVESEMRKIGATGKIRFITGNSHETLPVFLTQHPDLWFDLVTVDGDHTASGARRDLNDVLPRVSTGGAVVFDDIAHPMHPDLLQVWEESLNRSGRRFKSASYNRLGYGVALAICVG